MSTHMKKVEVLSVLRALASKYAERNDFQKGLSYIERAEKLSKDLLQDQDHELVLLLAATKVDILNKQHRFGTEEQRQIILEVAKLALDQSKRMYGEDSLMTSKMMIDYGLTLMRMKSESSKTEGEQVLKKA